MSAVRRVRNLRLGVPIAFTLAVYSVVIIATVASGESDAPWLPVGADASQSSFWFVVVPVIAAGGIGGYIYGGRAAGVARETRSATPNSSWLGKGPTPYELGMRWLFSGWRRWTVGVLVALYLVGSGVAMLLPEFRAGALAGFKRQTDGFTLALCAYASAWMVWALTLKGREIRRGKERIKVADEYLAIREARLHAEVDAMCEKFLQQQQEWKAQKTAELYEQILDQQARGLLPCPTCRDRHGEHGMSA